MLWTMLLTYPLMAGIQEISAWIGRVTGIGLAGNIRRHYPPIVVNALVALLLIANVINLGADIGAMGSALKLVVGGPALLYSVVFGVISVIAAIVFPYKQYAEYLKWSTLVLFVYAATAMVVKFPLMPVVLGTFIPTLSFSSSYLTALTAVLGTTISPYLFFWQASVEVAEQKAAPREKPLKVAPKQAPAQLQRMRSGTYLGMAFSNIIAFFIILDTAAVLHAHGITDIQTGAQAAEALRPLAGELAFLLFSIGIIGTGLIAIPVLAGSSAYALAEALKWPIGLERKLHRAKGFYGILTVATVRSRVEFHRTESYKGTVLERGYQWRSRGSYHDCNDAHDYQQKDHRRATTAHPSERHRMDSYGVMFAVAACMLATMIWSRPQILDEFDNRCRGIAWISSGT